MMNGELMEQAVGGKPGSFLADLLEQAQQQSPARPSCFMVNHLYLAALSRYPTASELHAGRALPRHRTPTRSSVLKTCSGPCSTPTSSS